MVVRAVLECQPGDAGSVRRRDHLVSRRYRLYEPRYSRDISIAVTVQPDDPVEEAP
jgi:hypothetical protein